MEEELIFKSYSRALLRNLKEIKAALKGKDYERAEKLMNEIIVDTQKDVETSIK